MTADCDGLIANLRNANNAAGGALGADAPLRLAYADPPYYGCCNLYGHEHGDGSQPWDGHCWDTLTAHALLFDYLSTFDGWAYCMSVPSLDAIKPLAPKHRTAAWVKPFAAFKANVRIAYTWEPVLFWPGHDRSADGAPVGRDHLSEPITLKRGLTGAKPARFNRWVLDLLGYVEGDEVTDLFPGTDGMATALAQGTLDLRIGDTA